MQLEADATAVVIKRLRRIEGQVGGIIRMLEQGRDCVDIVTQLAAVHRALDRAGFKLLASGMRQCIAEDLTTGAQQLTPDQMERLFLSLA